MVMGLFLKRQWRTSIRLILLLLVVLFFQNAIVSQFTDRYYSAQTAYLARSDISNQPAFFAELQSEVDKTNDIVSAIQNYSVYEGNVAGGTVDLLDFVAGNAGYADYDMIVWREEMLQMPGRLTDTVLDDFLMLEQLSERLHNQKQLNDVIENNIEIMRRGIRRNDSNSIKYQAALKEYLKIQTNEAIGDTFFTDKLLAYMEGDYYIIIVVVLSVFSIFSNIIQQKISNAILVSKMGIRKFVFYHILVAEGITFLCLLVYYMGIVFLFSGGRIAEIQWDMPIQAVNGYENILFAVSVKEYFAVAVGLKLLYCLLVAGVSQFLSMVSKTTAISMLLSFLYCGILVTLFYAFGTSDKIFGSSLLIGVCKSVLVDLPFLIIGNWVIPYPVCYACGVVLLLVVVNMATIWISNITAKKWVN